MLAAFAAAAPKDVPEWFKPHITEKEPEGPTGLSTVAEWIANRAEPSRDQYYYVNDFGIPVKERCVPELCDEGVFEKAVDDIVHAEVLLKRWCDHYREQCVFQWPWAYAQGVMNARAAAMEANG